MRSPAADAMHSANVSSRPWGRISPQNLAPESKRYITAASSPTWKPFDNSPSAVGTNKMPPANAMKDTRMLLVVTCAPNSSAAAEE